MCSLFPKFFSRKLILFKKVLFTKEQFSCFAMHTNAHTHTHSHTRTHCHSLLHTCLFHVSQQRCCCRLECQLTLSKISNHNLWSSNTAATEATTKATTTTTTTASVTPGKGEGLKIKTGNFCSELKNILWSLNIQRIWQKNLPWNSRTADALS